MQDNNLFIGQRNPHNLDRLSPIHDNNASDVDYKENNFDENGNIDVNLFTNLRNINLRSSSHLNLKGNNNVT